MTDNAQVGSSDGVVCLKLAPVAVLNENLLRGIQDAGFSFEGPTALPRHVINACGSGRDVIVQGLQYEPTRYASLAIAVLHQIVPFNPNGQAIVVAPSHGAAKKIEKVILEVGKDMGITCAGGKSREKLETGVQVVVGPLGVLRCKVCWTETGFAQTA
jgi:superfamily II DNA/RNA helicase